MTEMNLLKGLIIIAIFFLSITDTVGQTDILSNRLQIGISAGYGKLSWITKYSVKLSSNPQSDFLRDTDYKNTGTASSIDINVLYMIRKCGFGISIGRRNYQVNELIADLAPQFTIGIPDEHINLFGTLFNFEIFQKNHFKIRPEIGIGMFSFSDSQTNKNFDNKLFVASQIKLEYQIKDLNLFLAPNYEYANSKTIIKYGDGTALTFKNQANLVRINFGVAYTVNMRHY